MSEKFFCSMEYEIVLLERCLRDAGLKVQRLPSEQAFIYVKPDRGQVKVTFEELS